MFGLRPAPRADRAELAAAIERTVAERRSAAAVPRRAARRFDGAVVDRLTASWLGTAQAIDQELRGQLDLLRRRSRDLFKNNEYCAKFARQVRNNVVGPEGFTLQARIYDPSGKPDSLANNAIERAWWRWMRPGNCELTGKRSFIDVCRNIVTTIARDGECLVREVRGAGFGEHGYQLQVVDIDRLDTSYNVEGAQGRNPIVMGVELDSFRRPVAYHVFESHPNAGVGSSRRRERWPAEGVFHLFLPLEDEQTRGAPWVHAAMRRLNDLNGYREAAVIAARIGACKGGFYVSQDGLPPPNDGEDDEGNFITEAAPGEFGVLPHGYDFKAYDPTYPHDQFDAFCKAALRGIASAIGSSYHTLANDLEGVNFSSIRAGVLEERDEWMAIQNWLTGVFLVPVFERWLAMALTLEKIRLPNGAALPIAKIEKFREHAWQGRRWQWVDPLKDINAAVVAINNGLASPQQIAAQAGRDVEDVLDDIAAFHELAKAKGLTLPGGMAPMAPEPDE